MFVTSDNKDFELTFTYTDMLEQICEFFGIDDWAEYYGVTDVQWDEFNGSYGTFFSAGGAISYKVISLGIEARWGKTKYQSLVDLGDITGEDGDFSVEIPKSNWKTASTRFYISFRF